MNLQTIKTDQYWLLVDTEADKKQMRKWYYAEGEIKLQQLSMPEYHYLHYQLIVAHLPINAPLLEGVLLLPELPKQEEDVDFYNPENKFRQQALHELGGYSKATITNSYGISPLDGYAKGYKAASQGRMYSEKVCIDAVVQVLSHWKTACINVKGEPNIEFLAEIEMTLQSLSPVQEDEWVFEPEWEETYNWRGGHGERRYKQITGKRLKTTPTEAGDIVIGKWIRK